ncbi:MAG: site-specific DNA-methyltransferase, partial [Candidatus Moraniibacteriota bacterium]
EFMYQRLVLARDLLSDDGVLFISIDDGEFSHLSMLMEQIWPGRKAATFVWKRRSGANDAKEPFVSVDHEYVICYAAPNFSFKGKTKENTSYSNPDHDKRGVWANDNLVQGKTMHQRKDAYYPIQNPESGVWYPCDPDNTWRFASETKLKPGQKIRTKTIEQIIKEKKVLWPQKDKTVTYKDMPSLLKAIDEKTAPYNLRRGLPDLDFWVGKTMGYGKPRYKRHLSEVKKTEKPLSTWIVPYANRKDIDQEDIDEKDVLITGYTSDGTSLVSKLLGHKAFDYPKPLALIKALIQQATDNQGDIVLDFFAGTGTTAHAVLELNSEDNLGRRYIMVSSTEATENDPKKNICRDVLSARVKAVIDDTGDLTGNNYAYIRTRPISFFDIAYELKGSLLWTLIQLQNDIPVTPYNSKLAIQSASKPEVSIVYVDQFTDKAKKELEKLCAEGPVVAYSWAPGQVREGVKSDNLEVRPVPDDLIRGYKS